MKDVYVISFRIISVVIYFNTYTSKAQINYYIIIEGIIILYYNNYITKHFNYI